MFIWYYCEFILMVLLPLIVITQLLIPAFMGTPIFPFFRKVFMKKRKVEEEIRILKVEKEIVDLNKLKQELVLPEDLEQLRQHAAKAAKGE